MQGSELVIKVKKDELLAKLQANRLEHAADFKEADENYRRLLQGTLNEMLQDLGEGKDVDTTIRLVKPRSYDKEYGRAIQMLEVCLDEELELDQHQFAKYWMDEWDWTDSFLYSNAVYSTRVSNKLSIM